MMELEKLRTEIDELNHEILDLLNKRLEVVRKVGEYKKTNGLEVLDSVREEEIYNRLGKIADEKGIDKEFVRDVFEIIIKKARSEQE